MKFKDAAAANEFKAAFEKYQVRAFADFSYRCWRVITLQGGVMGCFPLP